MDNREAALTVAYLERYGVVLFNDDLGESLDADEACELLSEAASFATIEAKVSRLREASARAQER